MRGYRYEALDGVRGLAAQVVLVSHGLGMAFFPVHAPGAAAAEWFGRIGVMVFFALSGFVIATSLSRLIESDRARFAVPYAVHRIARIWPPLVLAIVITFAVGALGHAGLPLLTKTGEPYRLDALSFLRGITLTFAPGDATFVIDRALWSLRQEVWLYALAAFAGLAFVGRGAVRLVAGAAACAMVAATADRFFYLQSLALFAAGAAAALLGGHPRMRALAASSLVSSATLLAWLAPLGFVGHPGFIDAMSENGSFLAYQAAIGAPLALTLLGLAANDGPAARVFLAIRGLAAFSYTLYVIHVPVMTLVFSLSACAGWLSGPSGTIATLAVAFVVAETASFAAARLVERPKLLRRLLFTMLARAGLWRPALRPAGPSAA